MSDYVTLSCPSCGGKLEITSDIDRFACAHCGTEHVVRRGGGLVSLTPVTEEIRRVRTGVDKTASELAIARLTKEIEEIEKQKTQSESTGCVNNLVIGTVVSGQIV
jgi:primosomal protein N'